MQPPKLGPTWTCVRIPPRHLKGWGGLIGGWNWRRGVCIRGFDSHDQSWPRGGGGMANTLARPSPVPIPSCGWREDMTSTASWGQRRGSGCILPPVGDPALISCRHLVFTFPRISIPPLGLYSQVLVKFWVLQSCVSWTLREFRGCLYPHLGQSNVKRATVF